MMGLSREERIGGIYFAIKAIREIDAEWDRGYRHPPYYDKERFAPLRKLIRKLWHAFLGCQSNGMHWIIGSASSNTVKGGDSPWEQAISTHCEDAFNGLRKELDPESCIVGPDPDYDPPFNTLDFTSLSYLLSHDGMNAEADTFKVYQWVEQLIYYLRRYDDETLASFAKLSKIVSDILGECFTIFSQNQKYAQAYLIREIMTIWYGPRYPYDKSPDCVVTILSRNAMHHDFTALMKWEMSDIVRVHCDLVKAQVKANRVSPPYEWMHDKELLRVRLLTLIRCCKSLHEYEHERKDAIKDLKEAGMDTKEVLDLLKLVAQQFKENKEKENKKDDHSHDMDALGVYGYEGYDILSDHLKKEGVEEDPVAATFTVVVPSKKQHKKAAKIFKKVTKMTKKVSKKSLKKVIEEAKKESE
jgi:hypothetical protein